jgi:hypothetical protein
MTFGFFPKISTTVENAVEKPGPIATSTAEIAFLLAFPRGESPRTPICRPLAADPTAEKAARTVAARRKSPGFLEFLT